MMKKLQIEEMKGICLSENKASVRVLEKCGFEKQFEGPGIYQGKRKNICIFRFAHPLP